MHLLSSVEFFQETFFKKNISGTLSNVKQFGSRPGQLLCQCYWVQTVCKSYQQMTLEGKDLTHSPLVATIVIWDLETILSKTFISFNASGDFCHLLLTFENMLDHGLIWVQTFLHS